MNILTAINRDFIPQLTVLLSSLLCSNPDETFTVYLAHSRLSDDDFEFISSKIDSSRCILNPVFISDHLFDDCPCLERISKETYYRLLAIDFLPQDVDRILYLDADTIVINSISDLYNIDFGDNLIAACTHVYGFLQRINRRRLNMPKDSKYINAGVMMMNISGLRACGISTHDIFDFISNNSKKLRLADQDVINSLYANKILLVDNRVYNLDEKILLHESGHIDIDWVKKNTVIVHFNGPQKPWQSDYPGRLAPLFDKYSERLNLSLGDEIGPDGISTIERDRRKVRKYTIITIAAILITVFAAIYIFAGDHMLEVLKNPTILSTWLEGFGIWARVIFALIRALQTVFKFFPAEPLEVGAGYAFGTFGGLLWCMVGTFLGSLFIILLTKVFGAKVLSLVIPPKKLHQFKFMQNKNKIESALFIMYLIPSTPKDLFTYMAAFLPMRISRFMLITSFARIPSILMSTWVGAELGRKNYLFAVVIFFVPLVIGWMYLLIRKLWLRRKEKAEETV